jgi:hypothetical protein
MTVLAERIAVLHVSDEATAPWAGPFAQATDGLCSGEKETTRE